MKKQRRNISTWWFLGGFVLFGLMPSGVGFIPMVICFAAIPVNLIGNRKRNRVIKATMAKSEE